MKPITQSKVRRAIALLKQGLSTRQVGEKLGISHTSVTNIRRSAAEDIAKKSAGRPRKIGDEMAQHLKLGLKRGLFKSSIDAQKEANKLLPSPVSSSTIRRCLRRTGMRAKKVVKRPFLKNNT
ncbi:hypothetical protein BX616_009111 [Lobosporangium transversale]|nr:hypothetical protein BX616_009111 [Lobosporangium transversale]